MTRRREILVLIVVIPAVAVAVTWWLIADGPPPARAKLLLAAEKFDARVDEPFPVRVVVVNDGDRPVSLVHPSDGSWAGMRTPVVQWSVAELDESLDVVGAVSLDLAGCGNYNAAGWDEVFRLAPGESRDVSRFASSFPLWLLKPGLYSITLSYRNDPAMEWERSALGMHNPISMWKIRRSTPCEMTSNALVVRVRE